MPSTVIRDFAYDSDTRELTIGFVSGRTYIYSGVPPETHAGLVAAGSRGAFFNAYIRDHFRCEDVIER